MSLTGSGKQATENTGTVSVTSGNKPCPCVFSTAVESSSSSTSTSSSGKPLALSMHGPHAAPIVLIGVVLRSRAWRGKQQQGTTRSENKREMNQSIKQARLNEITQQHILFSPLFSSLFLFFPPISAHFFFCLLFGFVELHTTHKAVAKNWLKALQIKRKRRERFSLFFVFALVCINCTHTCNPCHHPFLPSSQPHTPEQPELHKRSSNQDVELATQGN